jgi:hypothetical protein
MEHLNPRPTDLVLRMKCPGCNRTLSLMTVRPQLTFSCPSGHAFFMRQLFRTQAENVRRGLEEVLSLWKERLAALEASAAFARREGRQELAQNFQREIDLLDGRCRLVRETLEGLASERAGGSIAS